ncbi:MAG: hypothetical protein M1142_01375 [Patescibacteria group bacterium]|nr:hypothetical protein [Patescibacteria group bacterium]
MAGESKTTTNHEEIKKWVEQRGGRPAIVRGTEKTGEGIGLLRIDFQGDGEGPDPSLRPISWEEFFQTFDGKNLAFLYQDQTAEGKESRFFKLVSRT